MIVVEDFGKYCGVQQRPCGKYAAEVHDLKRRGSEASRPRADWGSAGKMERAEEDDQKTAHWLRGPFAWERKSRWIKNERWRWWGSCNVTSLSKY